MTSRAAPTARQARLRAFRLNLTLWTLQAWLAMFFIGAAYAKLTEPSDMLVVLLGWPSAVDLTFVRALGTLELAFGVAMAAPLVSKRIGTPIMIASAFSLAVLAAGTMTLHLGRSEFGFAALNLGLATIAMIVGVGRSIGGATSGPVQRTVAGQI